MLEISMKPIPEFENTMGLFIWLCVRVPGDPFFQNITNHVNMSVILGEIPVFVWMEIHILLQQSYSMAH